jgi:hypothetical protein
MAVLSRPTLCTYGISLATITKRCHEPHRRTNLTKTCLPPMGTEDDRTGTGRRRDVAQGVHASGGALAIHYVVHWTLERVVTAASVSHVHGLSTLARPYVRARTATVAALGRRAHPDDVGLWGDRPPKTPRHGGALTSLGVRQSGWCTRCHGEYRARGIRLRRDSWNMTAVTQQCTACSSLAAAALEA